MDNIVIRKAKSSDLDEIYAIETSVEDAWSLEILSQDLIQNAFSQYLVAIIEEEIVGFISVMNIAGEVHVNNIAVQEKSRGKGIGEELLKAGMEFYPSDEIMGFTLEVRVDNTPALRLYEKMGFITVGVRERYYKNNKDAYIMWKMIEEQ